MKITINFEKPYFDEATILALTSHDLDDFYVEANEVDRLNLFFMLETSLHRFQRESGCTLRLSHGILSVRSPDASGFVGTGEVLYRPGAGMGGYAGVPPVEKTDRRRKLKLI